MSNDGRIPGEATPAQDRGELERRLQAVERGDHLAGGPVVVGALVLGAYTITIEPVDGVDTLVLRNRALGLTSTIGMIPSDS